MAEVAVPLLVGLAPVLGLLAALVLLESYKIVRLSTVVGVVAAGAAVAAAWSTSIAFELIEAVSLLLQIYQKNLSPDAAQFADLERKMFEAAPLVSGCNLFI